MGNTTAATGKGFAIGSAVLTAAALMAAFMNSCGVYSVNVRNPLVICGMLLGAMLPYIFAAITMLSVGQSAQDIMQDVRDQFKDKQQLKVDARHLEERREHFEDLEEADLATVAAGGTAKNADEMEKTREEMNVVYKKYLDDRSLLPDYDHTIKIATNAALNEMMIPGALAIFTPAAVGFLLGPAALAGLLIGALTSGFMLAIEMANAGGAWDNAKKWVEGGDLKFCGEAYKKGSPYHDATVVGDTVGDPFKDTSGPALNVLIKLMTLVSLVLAPAFKNIYPPNQDTNGFEEKGVIAGVIIIVVVGGFCYWWKMRSNAKNSKPEAKQTHSAAYWKAVKTVNQLLDDVSIENFDSKLKAAVADVKSAKWADGSPDLDNGSAGVVARSNLDASLSQKTA
jgi:K(+)-stimulated pyrophosphate-energized sodium pump